MIASIEVERVRTKKRRLASITVSLLVSYTYSNLLAHLMVQGQGNRRSSTPWSAWNCLEINGGADGTRTATSDVTGRSVF
jgi:hypothetical protein